VLYDDGKTLKSRSDPGNASECRIRYAAHWRYKKVDRGMKIMNEDRMAPIFDGVAAGCEDAGEFVDSMKSDVSRIVYTSFLRAVISSICLLDRLPLILLPRSH